MALNLPFWMRPVAMMSEESDPFDSTVVRPSIPRDHLEPIMAKVTRQVKSNDSILDAAAFHMADAKKAKSALDATEAALYQVCMRLQNLGVDDPWTLDGFKTEMGPRAKAERVGNRYNIRRVES